MRALAIVTTSLMTAAVAIADAPSARLEVAGACELDAVTNRTNELIGRIAISADERASFRVVTELGSDGAVATLGYVDALGNAQPARTISATSCDELAESVAVVVSLVLRQQTLDPPPPAPSPPPVEPIRELEPEVVPSIGHALTGSFELGGAAGSTGARSFMAGARLQRGRGAAGVELGLETPTELSIGTGGSVHVGIGRLNGTGCFRVGSISVCGLLTAGIVRGRGEGLMDARTATKPIAGVGARIEWRQLVSKRVGLRLFGDIEQLLVNTRFLVDDMPIWTTDSRQAWFGAGIFLQTL